MKLINSLGISTCSKQEYLFSRYTTINSSNIDWNYLLWCVKFLTKKLAGQEYTIDR